jgi:flagellar motor switch/type III secretory pathway protein FliN
MNTPLPPAPPTAARPREPEASAQAELAAEQALVPAGAQGEGTLEGPFMVLTAPLSRLPVELEVGVPVREFRVRNLLALAPGQVIESQWSHGDDVPLASGAVQLAWSEFEVIDTDLAVRVTRLA